MVTERSAPVGELATCPDHPDLKAVGTCSRCGRFVCAVDRRTVGTRQLCEQCAARPEEDYLQALRQKYWGRRDTWAWLFFIVGVGQALGAVALLVSTATARPESIPALVIPSVAMLGVAALSLFYWLGQKWARLAMLGLQVLAAVIIGGQAVVGLSRAGDADASALGAAVGAAVASAFVPLAIVVVLWFDGRNRLFFKIDVPRDKLQKLWDLYMNNPVARVGYLVSFLAVVLGPLALISIPLCIVGLLRVDPDSHPPQGRRGQAIAGLVLSAAGLALFVAIIVTARS